MPNQDNDPERRANSSGDSKHKKRDPVDDFNPDTVDYGYVNQKHVSELLEKARAGNDDAIQELCRQHFDALLRIARKKLRREMLRHVDPEDVVQSAMRQFFKKPARFDEIGNAKHFWLLLVRMTTQKALDYRRKHFAEKRGSGQTRGDSIFIGKGDAAGGFGQVKSPGTTPEFEASAQEQLERWLKILDANDPDAKRQYRAIVLFKLQGHKTNEIATALQRSKRTIERRVREIETIWNSELEG
jgi:RNA polymerase sigma factor (sigma-70 family)